MNAKAEHYDIILAPVVTEKSTELSEFNKVMFKVARTATKPQIKVAVEKLFGVKVEGVNTINRKGKNKVFRGRRGRQSDVRLAIVTLKDGERIDISSGI
jgi:large subunit ribosomal protein L23